MSLLFFLRPWDDFEAADRPGYFQPYFDEDIPRRKRKKVYRVIMEGKTANAEPISLRDMAIELHQMVRLRKRRRDEEMLILHLINEGEL